MNTQCDTIKSILLLAGLMLWTCVYTDIDVHDTDFSHVPKQEQNPDFETCEIKVGNPPPSHLPPH